MSGVYQFLTAHGLIDAVLKAGVLGLLGWLVRLVKEHVRVQREIRELMRTDTPGGNADVVAAIKDLHAKPAPRRKAPVREGEGRD